MLNIHYTCIWKLWYLFYQLLFFNSGIFIKINLLWFISINVIVKWFVFLNNFNQISRHIHFQHFLSYLVFMLQRSLLFFVHTNINNILLIILWNLLKSFDIDYVFITFFMLQNIFIFFITVIEIVVIITVIFVMNIVR